MKTSWVNPEWLSHQKGAATTHSRKPENPVSKPTGVLFVLYHWSQALTNWWKNSLQSVADRKRTPALVNYAEFVRLTVGKVPPHKLCRERPSVSLICPDESVAWLRNIPSSKWNICPPWFLPPLCADDLIMANQTLRVESSNRSDGSLHNGEPGFFQDMLALFVFRQAAVKLGAELMQPIYQKPL